MCELIPTYVKGGKKAPIDLISKHHPLGSGGFIYTSPDSPPIPSLISTQHQLSLDSHTDHQWCHEANLVAPRNPIKKQRCVAANIRNLITFQEKARNFLGFLQGSRYRLGEQAAGAGAAHHTPAPEVGLTGAGLRLGVSLNAPVCICTQVQRRNGGSGMLPGWKRKRTTS